MRMMCSTLIVLTGFPYVGLIGSEVVTEKSILLNQQLCPDVLPICGSWNMMFGSIFQTVCFGLFNTKTLASVSFFFFLRICIALYWCCIMPMLKIHGWVTLRRSVEHFNCYKLGYLKSTLQKVLEVSITQLVQDIITEWNFIFHMLKKLIEQKGTLMSTMQRNLTLTFWLSASGICWVCCGEHEIFKESPTEISPWEISFFWRFCYQRKCLLRSGRRW